MKKKIPEKPAFGEQIYCQANSIFFTRQKSEYEYFCWTLEVLKNHETNPEYNLNVRNNIVVSNTSVSLKVDQRLFRNSEK